MSTKQQTNTTQTNTYDPTSMNAFKTATNQMSGFTNQWLGTNGNAAPQSTPGFNLNYQTNLNQANATNARNMRNITSNALALGGNPNGGATQAILARAGRAATNTQQTAFTNAYQTAVGQQNNAAQMAASYRPLQTGGTQNTTQSQSGLGTWLPQVAGMGLGMATGFMNPMNAVAAMPTPASTATNIGANGPYGSGYAGFGIGANAPSYFGSY